jgi:nucleoside-diphosphate-sugar epimerase
MHTLGRKPVANAVRHHLIDITDRDAVSSAIAESQPEAIFNLAATGVVSGSSDLVTMMHVNTSSVEALLSASTKLPHKVSVVLVGTGFEYAMQDRPISEEDPIVPSGSAYGASKAAATAIAGAFARELPITLLRPFNVYGPGGALRIGSYIVSCARNGVPADVTPAEQLRDFLHVEDFSRGLWLTASAQSAPGFRTMNIGTGQSVSLRVYIEALVAALARHGLTAAVRFGARPYRPGEPLIHVADVRRIRELLNWWPLVSLEEGVKEMVDREIAA